MCGEQTIRKSVNSPLKKNLTEQALITHNVLHLLLQKGF